MKIDSCVALVTGAASGIGKASANAFLEAGMVGVILVDINKSLGENVCTEFCAKVRFVSTSYARGIQTKSAT